MRSPPATPVDPAAPTSPPGPPETRDARRGVRRPARLVRLALKELRETLRDRRTISTLLLMPILVYPLLSLVFQKFLLTQLRPVTGTIYYVAVDSEPASRTLHALLEHGIRVLNRESGRQDEAREPDDNLLPIPADPREERLILEIYPDAARAVAEFEADVGLRLTRLEAADGRLPLQSEWEVLLVESSLRSRAAAALVDRYIQAATVDLLRARLDSAGGAAELPVRMVREPVAAVGGGSAFSLGTLVPLILILMTMTGAVYPAIDLTAGERERGTLEALVAAPVPRMGLLLAKYVAVLAVALLTAGVNLTAMTATVLATGLGDILFGEDGLSLGIIASILGLLVLLAAFFSAVLLALTSFARSFKEAQAYLIPLMLVSLAPGMLSLVPGLKLNGLFAVIPLANIVLLARDLFDQAVDPAMAGVVIVSTGLYALGAIAIAARVFGTDAILYGSEGSWSEVLRRPAEPRAEPSAATAMFCLAVLFPLAMLTASMLLVREDWRLPTRLLVSSLASTALFGGIPLAVAVLRRIRLRSGFGLGSAPALGWLGALLLGLALWPLAYELQILTSQLARAAGVELLDLRLVEYARRLVEQFRDVSPAVVLLCLAVVPAVFEELFFRGFLFAGLRQRHRPAETIIATAVFFGLFHVVVRDVLALERLIPSTSLGLILGWVRYRTGSILPGMLLHACHNAVLLLLVLFQDRLQTLEWLNVGGWMTSETATGHLPLALLAIAATVAALAAAFVYFGTPAKSSRSAAAELVPEGTFESSPAIHRRGMGMQREHESRRDD